MGLPSVITGAMGLALLEVVVSSPQAAGRVGGLGTFGAAVVKRIVDPNVALIPNWHDASGPSSSSAVPPGATARAGTPAARTPAQQRAAAAAGTDGPLLPQLPKTRSKSRGPGRKPKVAPAVH